MNDSGRPTGPRERELFLQAADQPAGKERDAFLGRTCRNDPALRRRLEALLERFDQIGTFLERPAASAGDWVRQGAVSGDEAGDRTVLVPVTERAGDRIGRYKLLQQIGEGGCGVVYMAEQEEPVRRRVALKVIKLGMDTKSVIARFEAERQALALMDHPNIAKVLDAGATDSGRPFFVMELVRGIRITEHCDQNNLSTRERLDLFVQVCQAIQHAHQKGIIHRDIKPSNILVSLYDGVPVPVVIDFGIAKATEQKLTDKTLFTAFEQFIGTPAYTSPEQAEISRLDIDTRSDIYALGVLLYELLTGKTPFDARTLLASGLEEMRRIIRDQEPPRPSTRLDSMLAGELKTTAQRRQVAPPKLIHLLRGDLDWIVMKCLEKDRTRRYDTANGLAQDILHYLNREPVSARPPSMAYKLQKFVGRNKLMVGAGSTVATALVFSVAISTWQAVRATRAEREQGRLRRRAEQESSTARRNAYTASMLLAQADWEHRNLGHLRYLLEETREYPERGFEWYYWQERTHLAQQTLRSHGAAVAAVGNRIVSGGEDGTISLWEAAGGRELLTFKGDSVFAVAISRDGRRVVTGNRVEATVWDATTGQRLMTLKGHRNGPVDAVAVSSSGQRIATGAWEGGHAGTVKVWDAATGQELLTLEGHSRGVTSVAFSPDSRRIASGSADNTATVWNLSTREAVLILKGHNGAINSVAFSPDGSRIISGSADKTAIIWDTATGEPCFTLKGHEAGVSAVAFSADGERIATGSDDNTVRLWQDPRAPSVGRPEPVALVGHAAGISFVGFSPDGLWIITGSKDHTVKMWKADTDPEQPMLSGHAGTIYSMAFSPDGQRLVTGSADGTAKVWEVAGTRLSLTLKGQGGQVRSVAFSPDGQQIVTGAMEDTARIWDANSGREVIKLGGQASDVLAVAFSPDGRRVMTGGQGHWRMWEAAAGRELLTVTGLEGPAYCVAFSPDGQRVAARFGWQAARIWDSTTGRELLTVRGHTGEITSVAFSTDGRWVVTGSADQTAKVWESNSGRELLTLRGHTGMLWSVAFSPDARRIITGSLDGTTKVWDPGNGQALLTLTTPDGVWGLAMSPEGGRLVADYGGGHAKIWRAASPAQVEAWLSEESPLYRR